MAEFQVVMRQAKRMCAAHEACYKCPLKDYTAMCAGNKRLSCIASTCDVGEVESIVMSWAAKHPEPRYPAWYEWQKTTFPDSANPICPKTFMSYKAAECDLTKNCGRCIEQPIPAGVAEKLGIKPIGGKR